VKRQIVALAPLHLRKTRFDPLLGRAQRVTRAAQRIDIAANPARDSKIEQHALGVRGTSPRAKHSDRRRRLFWSAYTAYEVMMQTLQKGFIHETRHCREG
jgi:hypothetical protein